MLHVESLSFDYFDKPLLKNIHFEIQPGTLLHLQGENGSGKTTLLRLLAGLITPHKGDVFWNSANITHHLSDYQRQICYLGHKTGINSHLTVKENCYLNIHWPSSFIDLNELLAQFGLQGLADFPCYQLSAGQKRRVALMRLAFSSARLWLLDEPLTALDQSAIKALTNRFNHHLQQQGIIVITSHQPLNDQVGQYQVFNLR